MRVATAPQGYFCGGSGSFFVFDIVDYWEVEKMQTEEAENDVQTITSVKDMLPVAIGIVSLCCEEKEIGEREIDDLDWLDILDEIKLQLFDPNRRLLKVEGNLCNQYNKEAVEYVYEYIYKKLCTKYRQEVLQKGFLSMTGIDKQTLYNWSSDAGFDLQQKIKEDNEESIWARAKATKGNPIPYITKLNYYHGWNGTGLTKDEVRNKQLVSREEMGLEAPKERPALPGTGENP